MNKGLKILVGIILIFDIVVIFLTNFIELRKSALFFLFGGIICFVILIGLIFLILGLNGFRGEEIE